MTRRSETQWNIFFSTTDGRWFAPQPALNFEAPAHGYLEINDLNGDGLADIIWHESDAPRLSIFMSPSRQAKAGSGFFIRGRRRKEAEAFRAGESQAILRL